MTDRRRINGPPSGTTPLIFASELDGTSTAQRPCRAREPKQHRKIFLRTGLTPSASGSAYLELQSTQPQSTTSLISLSPSLKISCTVHGPKPLPRSAPFSPQLVLSTYVKFAPFASRNDRRGFVRDAGERDLGVHLEAALRSVIIGDRWPKSGVDVVVTILETEEDHEAGSGRGGAGGLSVMSVLAGCITVSCAAIVEAGIDCVDLITGGVAAVVRSAAINGHERSASQQGGAGNTQLVVDPSPSEHADIVAACVVGYLQSRDEISELWMRGDTNDGGEALIDCAIHAATAQRTVMAAVLKESVEAKHAMQALDGSGENLGETQETSNTKGKAQAPAQDIEMSG